MEFVIAILILLGICVGVTILVILAFKLLYFIADFLPDRWFGSSSSNSSEISANELERDYRKRAAYEAELIAAANKHPEGKVTWSDELHARNRHL